MFICRPDWALNPAKSGNFLDIDVRNRKATLWDSGKNRFTNSTTKHTGLAIAKVLLNHEMTANKQVFISDFVASQRDILASLEKQLGETFTVEEKESAPVFKEMRAKFDAGDFNAVYKLIALSFVGDLGIEYDFETKYGAWNEKLGLPKTTLDEVVKEAIELASSTT
jgi:hypothetical protein